MCLYRICFTKLGSCSVHVHFFVNTMVKYITCIKSQITIVLIDTNYYNYFYKQELNFNSIAIITNVNIEISVQCLYLHVDSAGASVSRTGVKDETTLGSSSGVESEDASDESPGTMQVLKILVSQNPITYLYRYPSFSMLSYSVAFFRNAFNH